MLDLSDSLVPRGPSAAQDGRQRTHEVSVLGIAVPSGLVHQWRQWLLPLEQPYVVPRQVATRLWLRDDRARLTPEWRDTFALGELDEDERLCWLDRSSARRLPTQVRAAQPAQHRFPTGNISQDLTTCLEVVEGGRRHSRHAEISDEVWSAVGEIVPHARALAGHFPDRSGPNAFGTVMGAAGVDGAPEREVPVAEFEDWLAASTEPVAGEVNAAGTVYVWRDAQGTGVHSAISLGAGYALHKAGRGWMHPTVILTTRGVISSSRGRGRWLHRYRPHSASR